MSSRVTKNNQIKEITIKNTRENIKDDLLNCFKLIHKDVDINVLLKQHKKLIDHSGIGGKNRFKTLTYLVHYKNTKNKSTALTNLTNTLNNLHLLAP